MNASFPEEWCVLHSYETLPEYSESDVDMAFSGTSLKDLERLIEEVAKKNGWQVYQKFWYDVPHCFYYVLRNKNNEFLAIDFLIDNRGIGRYGFETKILTDECEIFKGYIPIPSHEAAFCYKVIKRIVKQKSLIDDKKYLLEHFKLSEQKSIEKILLNQLGPLGAKMIIEKMTNENVLFNEEELNFLIRKKKEIYLKKGKFSRFLLWELKRYVERILSPRGIILLVPDLNPSELQNLKECLEKRVDLLFRDVKINGNQWKFQNFKGLSGSTLILQPTKKFHPKRVIKNHLFSNRKHKTGITRKTFSNIPEVADNYYELILITLKLRKWKV